MRHIQAGILAQASNASFRLPRKTPSDIYGGRFAHTATALRGIHTRFPVIPVGIYLYTTLYLFPKLDHIIWRKPKNVKGQFRQICQPLDFLRDLIYTLGTDNCAHCDGRCRGRVLLAKFFNVSTDYLLGLEDRP